MSYRLEVSSKTAFQHKTLKSAAQPLHLVPAWKVTFKWDRKCPSITHMVPTHEQVPFPGLHKRIKRNRLNLFRQIQSQNRLTFPSSKAKKNKNKKNCDASGGKTNPTKISRGTCFLRRHIFHCLVFTLTTKSPHSALAVGQTKHPKPGESGNPEAHRGGRLPSLGASLCGWGPRPSPGTLASLPSDASSKRDGSSRQWQSWADSV